ncbi:hypothetical protein C0Q88_22040 [Ralstonia pickettii]|uniref:Uncharacterized protein n=1 Tax=Ralstonia pickettii TaxID=329 RepID=A0A2N4TLB8_RALPI|nr:hypothetical protein [Ralstonia pickettii]PLC40486.1 hypothetical protein C0Q88_22040 [Ralstonia pickettii]
MAFEYFPRGAGAAIDHERMVSVKPGPYRDLDTDCFVYSFQDERSAFEFDTVEFFEDRPRLFQGHVVTHKFPVLTCVIEPDLRRAFAEAAITADRTYAEVRALIQEALFVLKMQGEALRPAAPDYRVEFVQSVTEARHLAQAVREKGEAQ